MSEFGVKLDVDFEEITFQRFTHLCIKKKKVLMWQLFVVLWFFDDFFLLIPNFFSDNCGPLIMLDNRGPPLR